MARCQTRWHKTDHELQRAAEKGCGKGRNSYGASWTKMEKDTESGQQEESNQSSKASCCNANPYQETLEIRVPEWE